MPQIRPSKYTKYSFGTNLCLAAKSLAVPPTICSIDDALSILRDIVMRFSSSLKLNHIFQRLYHSKGVADGYLVLYARRNRTGTNRVGITVGKKLGKAHIRNRTRRRIREVYRLNEEAFLPGWDIVVVARSKAVDAEFARLTKSYLTLAKKAGILRPDAQ